MVVVAVSQQQPNLINDFQERHISIRAYLPGGFCWGCATTATAPRTTTQMIGCVTIAVVVVVAVVVEGLLKK